MPIPPPPAATNAVVQSALALISSSLRLIGVLAAGESIDIAAANDSLMVFNQMIDSWNADRLTIFAEDQNDFAFTLGQQTYTLGSGGDFDMTRPARITGMSSILLNNPTNPVEVPLDMYTRYDWQTKLPVKAVDSSFPQVCYDDGNFPLRNLNFWPIPTLQQNNVRIYSWQPLVLASSLNASIVLPPGYAEAFRYNLAVRLSPEFNQPSVSPVVQQIAVSSLGTIKTMNAPELELKSDLLATEAGYNYRADLFGIGF
jgi:hypothetical protein